jgi:KUP system potassium uptake protein
MAGMKFNVEGAECFLVQLRTESNLWKVVEVETGKVVGMVGVYVDDILLSGPQAVVDALIAAFQKLWETSKPEVPSESTSTKFCGLEIKRGPSGSVQLAQKDYVMDLVARYAEELPSGHQTQPWSGPDDFVEEPEYSTAELRRGQTLAGELQWLAQRSRVDIALAVSKMAQMLTRAPKEAVVRGLRLLAYLRDTQDFYLEYLPTDQVATHSDDVAEHQEHHVECFTDASFAPSCMFSQSGAVVVWCGAIVAWHTSRQSLMAQSSAEAELVAAMDGAALVRGISPLVAELVGQEVKTWSLVDNTACVAIVTSPSTSWRTRHLKIRAAGYVDLVERGVLHLRHVPGATLVADALTKPLATQRLRVDGKVRSVVAVFVMVET